MKSSPAADQVAPTVLYESGSLLTIKIDKQKCLLLIYSVFAILVLFEPDYIITTPIHTIFRITKYAIAFITVLVFIIKKINLNSLIIGTIVFELWLLLSTIVNRAAIEVWIRDCAYIIVFVLFAQTVLERDAQVLPLALSIVLGLYTHINTICRLLFPSGMYTNSLGYTNCWLLGYDNPACMIIHLAITVALFRILYYKNHFLIWDWSVLLSGFWFIFVQNVATAIIAETIFVAFLIFSINKTIRNNFSKATLIVIGMFLLFFLIQLTSIQVNSALSFIFNLFGKSTTLSGRTRIWKVAWDQIQSGGWFFGRGLQTTDMYLKLFGGYCWIHIHNYYLQIIFEGGFAAFVIFFAVLICTAIRFDRGKYSYAYMPLLAGLLAIMVMWQAEAHRDLIQYGFVILSLMYNADLFVQGEEDHTSRIQLTFHRS